MVNSDGKVPIKAQNSFLWFIMRHLWEMEAFFIQSKCIVIK